MKKIIISGLFLSSFVFADFPYNVPPFDKQEKLLKDCVVDLLCGEYLYETGQGEYGSARIFKYKDVYYIHYIRDDEVDYIGLGVLSSNYLAVTYIYPGFSGVGTTHYEVKDGNLYGFFTCLGCDGQAISENLYKN